MARKKASANKKKAAATAKKPRATKLSRAAKARKERRAKSAGQRVGKSTPVEPPMTASMVNSQYPPDENGILVREAHRADIPHLEAFVERFVQANRLLPRTTDELYDLVPFGFVAWVNDQLVGFAALEIYSAKLAEVRSLAVHEDYQGRGIGKRLVQKCVDLAHMRNILEVMAITSSDGFFKSCGFEFTLPGEKKALFMQTRDQY